MYVCVCVPVWYICIDTIGNTCTMVCLLRLEA